MTRPRPALLAAGLAAAVLTACTADGPAVGQAPPSLPAPSVAPSTVAATTATGIPPVPPAPPASPGSGPAVASVSPSSSSAPATPAGSPPAPAVPRLSWKPCKNSSFQCSSLIVPVDHAKPAGPTLTLALIRRPAADPSRRIGSLVVNPGGPGGSGVEFVRDNSDVFSGTLRSRFDIVGFDPRGVGLSRGVDCSSDAQLDEFFQDDPVPLTASIRSTYREDSQAFAQRCNRVAPDLLAHVGTVEAARDLDLIRAALGEAQLTYFGYSYGTYLGATYAELFPGRVRAAVLDGAVDPSLDLVGFVTGQAQAFEAALNRWFAWCTPAAGCPFAGTGGRTVQQRFDAVADAVRAKPLAAGGRRTLGPGEFSYGVGYAMYARSLWPALAAALADAEGGDGAALLSLSDDYTDRDANGHYSDATDANYAVNCLDHEGPRTEQGWYDAARAVRASAPRLGEAIVYNTLPCAFWPVPGRPVLPLDAAGSAPLLVIGTLHDPATPYAWAQSLARQLGSGVLLTYDGDGHTAYGPGAPCVVKAADRYLVDLVPPAAGTRC